MHFDMSTPTIHSALVSLALTNGITRSVLDDPQVGTAAKLAVLAALVWSSHFIAALAKASGRKLWDRWFPKDPVPVILKQTDPQPSDSATKGN